VGLFAVATSVVFAVIWWAATTFMLRQTDDLIESEIWTLAEQYDDRGLAALSLQISSRQRNEASRSNIYLLVDRDFHYLAGNMRTWPAAIEPKGYPEWFTITVTAESDARRLTARVRVITLPGKIHLLVGRELSDLLRARSVMALGMAAGIFVMIIVGLVFGGVITKKLLGRLERVNQTSREIMGGALERRIPVSGRGDELYALAQKLNDMLDRIEELVATVRQVSDNIAHDLRSPITRLRSRLELALLEAPDTASQRQAMEEAIAQAESIIATFNALLTIARAESSAPRSAFEPLSLTELVLDAAELYEPLAEDKQIGLSIAVDDGLQVTGNKPLLAQAVANLLDNAVKYTPEGGAIQISAKASPSPPSVDAPGMLLTVADSGPGIPPTERENVLRRFYRLDQSRGTPGSGLGLSLVAAVARLHNARLTLADNSPGLVVQIAFPA